MVPDYIHDILEALKAIGSALLPAAIGSAVAQAWEQGLSLRDRCIQWVVGICVSYYVTLGIGAYFEFGPFASQAVGFVVAMIAFKATPNFISGCSTMVGTLPTWLRDRFLGPKV